MSLQNPDWAKCPASDITGPDLPPTWSDTSIIQCGFIFPSDQPMTQFQDCCLNDPQVQNSCFHYCQTDNSGVFPGCVLMNLHVNGSLQVACNTQTATANEASWVVGATSNWKTRLVVVSLAVFAFL